MYITCSVILCEPGNPFSRCSQGCLTNPSRRRRRALNRETVAHHITQGPLQVTGKTAPGAAVDDKRVVMKKSGIPAAGWYMLLSLILNKKDANSTTEAVAVLLSVSVSTLPLRPVPESPETKSSQGGWKFEDILNTNISTLVFASAFIISVMILAVVVHRFSRRRKAEDQNALIPSSNWEN